MLLSHGTTLNRFKEILKSGFIGGNISTVWNVSETNCTYFWSEKSIRDEYGDGVDKEQIKNDLLRYASESAEIALGLEDKNLKRVVLFFNSRSFNKDDLTPDYSSEHMDHCLCHYGLIPISKIKEVWIDSEPLDPYTLYFKGACLSMNNGRSPHNPQINGKELSPGLEKGALALYEALSCWWLEEKSCWDIVKVDDWMDLK